MSKIIKKMTKIIQKITKIIQNISKIIPKMSKIIKKNCGKLQNVHSSCLRLFLTSLLLCRFSLTSLFLCRLSLASLFLCRLSLASLLSVVSHVHMQKLSYCMYCPFSCFSMDMPARNRVSCCLEMFNLCLIKQYVGLIGVFDYLCLRGIWLS